MELKHSGDSTLSDIDAVLKSVLLKKAYLDGALKGNLKGQRDPIGHLTTRSRWATYW